MLVNLRVHWVKIGTHWNRIAWIHVHFYMKPLP